MKIWDNMKKFAQPYSDDDEYEDDDYEEEFEEEVEEEPVRRAPRRSPVRAPRTSRRPAPQREPAPVEEDDEEEDEFEAAYSSVSKPASAPAPAPVSFPGKVVGSKRGNAQEIVRFHPTTFQDSRKAATDLVASKAVIVNLEELDKDSARRMVDFLSGVVFAMNGEVQKIAQGAYVFCPPNVFITGGKDEVQNAAEEIL